MTERRYSQATGVTNCVNATDGQVRQGQRVDNSMIRTEKITGDLDPHLLGCWGQNSNPSVHITQGMLHKSFLKPRASLLPPPLWSVPLGHDGLVLLGPSGDPPS